MLQTIKLSAGGRHDIPPPRPATEALSGSLEPGRPSQARSANTRHPAGRPHTPPGMYATDVRQTDVRQTASSLNAPWAGYNKQCSVQRRFYRASAFIARRARYCCAISVCPSVSPTLKRMHISSYFDFLVLRASF